ncbi:hypothetical protein LINGRAHAP2_LOCUS11585 [Linum grandiflorum]
MSVIKDAPMTDISETQSTVEPECLQIAKRRKKKRVKKTHGSSGDTLADGFATDDNSGEKNTCVEEAGVDADSKDDSDRTQEEESITLQEMMMKVKKNKKRLKNLQPTTVLPSQEEAELLKEGGKKRKKRKNGMCSRQTVASKDEEQVGMITKVSSDSQGHIYVTGNTVCETLDVNEDEVDAESKKDLITIKPTESATFQIGGKKNKRKKKKKHTSDEILNSSQPADLLSSLRDGCLEKAQDIGFDQVHVSATENTTTEKNGCVDEPNIDVHSNKGSNITKAEESVTSQEERKKKKRKKAKINHQPADLLASQEEGCLEKIQKVSLPEISGTGNTISETGGHVNMADESAISKTEACTIQTTESASLQKEGTKKEDLNSPQSTEFIASQEKGTIQSPQYVGNDPHLDISGTHAISREDSDEIEMNTTSEEVLNNLQSTESLASQEKQLLQRTHTVGSDPQIDISTTGSFIGRDSDASDIDANPTKDMNNSQTSDLTPVEEEKTRKNQKDSNCVQPMQMPTAVEEGKRNKKRKQDSISSHPDEEEVLERIPGGVSQPDLSTEDNSVCIKRSCIIETEIVTNEKVDATSSQAAESIQLQKEGKKKRNELHDAQPVELIELQDGDGGKKQKKSLQHQEEKSFSPVCLAKDSAEQVDGKEAGVVTNKETLEVSIRPETHGKVSAETVDGNEAGLVSIKETGEVSTSPELISGHVSGNNLSDELMVDMLNGELNREQNPSVKAEEFVSTDSAPSNFSKEDVTSEDIKTTTEGADDIDTIARRSSIDLLNNVHASESLDMIPDRDPLEQSSTSLEAVILTGVEHTTSGWSNGDCAHRESKKRGKTETEICLDDSSRENIPQAGERKKKQKHSSKDGIIASEGKEPAQADDAVKALAEVKESSGLLQEQSGSLISASNESRDKDDSDGKPGIDSTEVGSANNLLKKDEVGLCNMKSKEHDKPTESGTESIINAGEIRGKDSDEDHPSKLTEELLIGEPAIVYSTSKEGVMCEELKTSPGGDEVNGRSSENKSNGDQSDTRCTSVKELEIPPVKNTNPSCSNLAVLLDERKKLTKITNVATGNDSISRVMTPLKRVCDVHTAKKLLILDINGLLVDIIPKSECPSSPQPDLNVSQKSVFRRPYCSDFLRFCFDNFAVGVWSSRTWYNLERVVKFLFRDSESNLLFCWDRSNCTETGVSTIDNPNKPLVLKELRRLWRDRKALPWKKGVFDASNTLLLDDSPYKALRNPVHTAIFPHSYKCTDAEDSALGPEGELRKYLERLLDARNVQEFVSENPFGQGPITASHPSWRFYRKIIIGE